MATFGKVGKRNAEQLTLFDDPPARSAPLAPKSEHAAFGADDLPAPRAARQLTYAEQVALDAQRQYDTAHLAWCDASGSVGSAAPGVAALWQMRAEAWKLAIALTEKAWPLCGSVARS